MNFGQKVRLNIDILNKYLLQIIHRAFTNTIGNELHHSGWNTCSSCHLIDAGKKKESKTITTEKYKRMVATGCVTNLVNNSKHNSIRSRYNDSEAGQINSTRIEYE